MNHIYCSPHWDLAPLPSVIMVKMSSVGMDRILFMIINSRKISMKKQGFIEFHYFLLKKHDLAETINFS